MKNYINLDLKVKEIENEISQGNIENLGEAITIIAPVVYSTLKDKFKNSNIDIKEIFSYSVLKLYENINNINIKNISLKGYLIQNAISYKIDNYRKEKTSHKHLEPYFYNNTNKVESPIQILINEEDRANKIKFCNEILSELDLEQSKILRMKHLNDNANKKIQHSLGIKKETLKSKIHRINIKIKNSNILSNRIQLTEG